MTVQQINQAIQDGAEITIEINQKPVTVLEVDPGRRVYYLVNTSRNGSFRRDRTVSPSLWKSIVEQASR